MLGPNGAGKSTLLDIAAGMRHPSRGEVRILGGRSDAWICGHSANASDMWT